MLRSLKIMIGLTTALLALVLILASMGYADPWDAGALAFQALILVLLFVFIRKESRIAIVLFAVSCLWLFLTGMMIEPSISGLVGACFAILGFIGLAGVWHWRQERAPR